MALLQMVQLEHLPPTHRIYIALYRNISNAAFLHQQLLAGNTSFEYALIDASVVSHPFLPSFPPPSCFVSFLLVSGVSQKTASRDAMGMSLL